MSSEERRESAIGNEPSGTQIGLAEIKAIRRVQKSYPIACGRWIPHEDLPQDWWKQERPDRYEICTGPDWIRTLGRGGSSDEAWMNALKVVENESPKPQDKRTQITLDSNDDQRK